VLFINIENFKAPDKKSCGRISPGRLITVVEPQLPSTKDTSPAGQFIAGI
jgi:hypothetical protein